MSLSFPFLCQNCENPNWAKMAIFSSFFEFQHKARKWLEWQFWLKLGKSILHIQSKWGRSRMTSEDDFMTSKIFDIGRWDMNFFRRINKGKFTENFSFQNCSKWRKKSKNGVFSLFSPLWDFSEESRKSPFFTIFAHFPDILGVLVACRAQNVFFF